MSWHKSSVACRNEQINRIGSGGRVIERTWEEPPPPSGPFHPDFNGGRAKRP
jgi:hypothetical protein